jgi:hypothetical protein
VSNAHGDSKDQFRIDQAAGTVTCPAEYTVAINTDRRQQIVRFRASCGSCPLQAECTKARP